MPRKRPICDLHIHTPQFIVLVKGRLQRKWLSPDSRLAILQPSWYYIISFTCAAVSRVGPQGLMGLLPTPQRVEKGTEIPLLACADTEHKGTMDQGLD